MTRPLLSLPYISDKKIFNLWKTGMNTADIAERYVIPEHVIANRIPEILAMARSETEK